MHITSIDKAPVTVHDLFWEPLNQGIESLVNRQPCSELPDEDWVRFGIERCLQEVPSGRAFLQENGFGSSNPPKVSNYFQSLRSPRRGGLLREANEAILTTASVGLSDRLTEIPELSNYHVFALDGHWHRGAVHDPRHKGAKVATGHFFSLNLRDHTLRHLAVNDYPNEHDMHVLKRIKPKGLRQGVPPGSRVLLVYDKAGIDFKFWQRCRKECAVYFLSRVKESMVYDWQDDFDWNRQDPINEGILSDRRIHTAEGIPMRLIEYLDPATGERMEFLTNETDLPPGVLVELYRRRWEIEKVYDEIKNKLGEQRSWSSDPRAKAAQGQFVALTHNLLLILEAHLEADHRVINHAEHLRRERRKIELHRIARRLRRPFSSLLLIARGATVRSVKFIRWLRGCLRSGETVEAAVPRLQQFYAVL